MLLGSVQAAGTLAAARLAVKGGSRCKRPSARALHWASHLTLAAPVFVVGRAQRPDSGESDLQPSLTTNGIATPGGREVGASRPIERVMR